MLFHIDYISKNEQKISEIVRHRLACLERDDYVRKKFEGGRIMFFSQIPLLNIRY